MAVDLQMNGTSLQTSSIVVNQIGDDSAPNQEVNLQQISRRDGAKLVSTVYQPKAITLTGRIKGTSLADLETNIDNFKRLVSVTDGRLDIEYAGTVRRFVVSCESIAIQRAHYHLTFAPFSVSLRVYDPPFGRNVSALGGNLAANEALSGTGITTQAYSSTVSFDGSATPKPVITFYIDTVGALTTIDERVQGKKNLISVGTAFNSGDVLIIDTDNQQVLWNGRPINYEGVFPEYEVGDNTIISTFYEGSAAIDQQQTTITDFVTIDKATNHQFQGFQVSASTTYFQAEVYLRRDINTRSGTLTLDIRNASGDNPGPTQVTNSSIAINITDIPVNGGFVRFKFATNPSLTVSTDYRLVLVPSGLIGNIYLGIAKGNPYANGRYGFSNNDGSVWRNDANIDMAFRIWKTSPSINWTIDKKVEYIKRYL